MPVAGEIKRVSLPGNYQKYQWLACQCCGKERWVRLVRQKPRYIKCLPCSLRGTRNNVGIRSGQWKGGRVKTKEGYILVWVSPDSFFSSMCLSGRNYVLEHRLIIAKVLGRCLQPWERVHHKDGIKDHNEYSNLKMTTAGSHIIEHNKGYRDGYQQGYQDGKSKAIYEAQLQGWTV